MPNASLCFASLTDTHSTAIQELGLPLSESEPW